MKNILSQILKDYAHKIEKGTCDISDEAIEKSIEVFSKFDNTQWLNKDQACKYMKMSRSTFDANVKAGNFPKGKKVAGWKEKIWTKLLLFKIIN